ncbi:hypothetical protein [Rhizobium sp. FKY42]|uniref:hypothetical protein n=1 Tax=Rhizobium sp. FKY42 TaxID=2562310 RepID=UPI0010C032C2|nr:hypothetical protein [Rhizobium sp. FKY42]
MVQIELYTDHLDDYADLFARLFSFSLIEEKPGWRQLRHPAYFDLMLFSPERNEFGESHWVLPERGEGGKGIEIVICIPELGNIREEIITHGFECSELRYPPWGSAEFFFKLHEGYFIRVKQPREFRK